MSLDPIDLIGGVTRGVDGRVDVLELLLEGERGGVPSTVPASVVAAPVAAQRVNPRHVKVLVRQVADELVLVGVGVVLHDGHVGLRVGIPDHVELHHPADGHAVVCVLIGNVRAATQTNLLRSIPMELKVKVLGHEVGLKEHIEHLHQGHGPGGIIVSARGTTGRHRERGTVLVGTKDDLIGVARVGSGNAEHSGGLSPRVLESGHSDVVAVLRHLTNCVVEPLG
eukprot:Rmarinus@m.16751